MQCEEYVAVPGVYCSVGSVYAEYVAVLSVRCRVRSVLQYSSVMCTLVYMCAECVAV